MVTYRGYDDISGCSYGIVVFPLEVGHSDDQIPNNTVSLSVIYKFIPTTTTPDQDHNRKSSFCLNRAPDAGQIWGLDDVKSWLNDCPGFPSVVGDATVEVITRALRRFPLASTPLVAVWVSREEARRTRARAAMDRIERVVIKETSQESCAVCLEEFKVGCSATRLPCDHVFHGNCIEKWFEKRIDCPLCRFKLSVDEVIASTSRAEEDSLRTEREL